MSNQIPFDLFAMWKDLYDKTESQWSKIFDESMRKEDFSEFMGQFLNMYLQYQNMVKQSTEKYLAQANMPSREDISNLASLIVNLEAKIDNLEEIIEEELSHQLNSLNMAREITQVKNEMKNLDKKLNQVMDLLQKQAKSPSLSVTKVEASKETTSKEKTEQKKE
ncbi:MULTISPECIES: poly(R)-hydroxyalkanoic acid synthase subunit PhaE [Aneurinibacillus]|uniref:Poly(3-hydroxyalkanoate) polymerase subunit PhaE n=1 Tax=Aneurinibacillus thermoaerophilus TaxID=143495 RepID=A0A1G7YMZ4_ANETH|nr:MULTISPECIES: poly(R)-hydroxyalkanoic acid synthase subunit PhaE [Aneurinibacillus]AMA73792.1 hypothetical protein ACH33_13625 [Aneurinibacillus sp. XH2]MED0676622.1 poly(R)-hydroxyalkanoic acid synthase subunit PhaE [Aneurinibacillus thermoaerophilus]MED0679391.1 poly(R)-hydroxyalkanoic acid synthase subunit PhaE [Aneurinibacillus thermoaerophilus]MED0738038.1 poly(R)-hydroxyalkanoic acid synthase subunit PhaE [Aneurinibacillus thermoaerophilus]MED0756459.1 poly(R)-hydroxyalkanoic acid syn